MSYDAEIEKLATAVVDDLKLRSKRIREQAIESLINDIEYEIESSVAMAEWREEDYEEGRRDEAREATAYPWWQFWRWV